MKIKLLFISLMSLQLIFLSLFVKGKSLANFPANIVVQSPSDLAQNNTALSSLERLKKNISFYKNINISNREYSPDGQFAFVISSDGWLKKIEIESLIIVGEVRVGVNSSNIAISNDGKYLLVGNTSFQNLVILNAKDLSIIKSIDIVDSTGVNTSVIGVYNAPSRYSFIIALKEVKEVWEIPYSDEGGVEVFKGWAHDYRKDGGEGKLENWKVEERFPIRRIRTETQLEQLFFDASYINLIAASQDNKSVHVINLDVKKQVMTMNIEGAHVSSTGVSWEYKQRTVFAFSNIKASYISVIDLDNGNVIKAIKTAGKSHSIASDINSPYIWLKTVNSVNNEIIQIISKDTLAVIKELRFEYRTESINIEFIQSGKFVLLSNKVNKGNEGEVIIFNATTLGEVNIK
jgi:WD40 repeat protein